MINEELYHCDESLFKFFWYTSPEMNSFLNWWDFTNSMKNRPSKAWRSSSLKSLTRTLWRPATSWMPWLAWTRSSPASITSSINTRSTRLEAIAIQIQSIINWCISIRAKSEFNRRIGKMRVDLNAGGNSGQSLHGGGRCPRQEPTPRGRCCPGSAQLPRWDQ